MPLGRAARPGAAIRLSGGEPEIAIFTTPRARPDYRLGINYIGGTYGTMPLTCRPDSCKTSYDLKRAEVDKFLASRGMEISIGINQEGGWKMTFSPSGLYAAMEELKSFPP